VLVVTAFRQIHKNGYMDIDEHTRSPILYLDNNSVKRSHFQNYSSFEKKGEVTNGEVITKDSLIRPILHCCNQQLAGYFI
jgi:hypothetical protein